jgi:hypothetical protein
MTDAGVYNTRRLLESIDRILKDEDVDPYRAPELNYPQKTRLARLFLNWMKDEFGRSDEWSAKWLESAGMQDMATMVRQGRHWEWIRAQTQDEKVPDSIGKSL